VKTVQNVFMSIWILNISFCILLGSRSVALEMEGKPSPNAVPICCRIKPPKAAYACLSPMDTLELLATAPPIFCSYGAVKRLKVPERLGNATQGSHNMLPCPHPAGHTLADQNSPSVLPKSSVRDGYNFNSCVTPFGSCCSVREWSNCIAYSTCRCGDHAYGEGRRPTADRLSI
jgi:hypothetical protein